MKQKRKTETLKMTDSPLRIRRIELHQRAEAGGKLTDNILIRHSTIATVAVIHSIKIKTCGKLQTTSVAHTVANSTAAGFAGRHAIGQRAEV